MSHTSLRYHYIPPVAGSRIDHVGTYRRSLPVSLERMYENTLDWEHLAHLHASSFSSIECLQAGGWGWRARTIDGQGRESEIELRLDRNCRRWITRTLAGANKGAEIWTHVFVTGSREMDIVIDYFVPDVPEAAREKVGRAYAQAYERLYDEDVWMMTERQRVLDQRLDSIRTEESLTLSMDALNTLPFEFELSGRAFLLHQHAGEWVVVPATCPHQLGPLTGTIDEQGLVHCPWHGYAFDVHTGACVTGSHCRLSRRPTVIPRDNELLLRWD